MSGINRRRFLKAAAAAGSALPLFTVAGTKASGKVLKANDRISFASMGMGGMGRVNTTRASKHGDVVAICDVDAFRLDQAGEQRFPRAKRYADFRRMFDDMHHDIDAVVISTPDHVHAAQALMAMRLGKHCYCEKPLARTVYEARLMGKVARQMGVATQMGNQGTARPEFRKAAAAVGGGALGAVHEVHVWTNRPIWPQGQDRPARKDPVPSNLDWDLWIGPSPMRPYVCFHERTPFRRNGEIVGHVRHKSIMWRGSEGRLFANVVGKHEVYHPFNWRGWWNFGTGALGDMGPHSVNLPFSALDLRDPVSVEAKTSGHNRDSFPRSSVVTYEFPERNNRPPVRMVWYDGGEQPDAALLGGRQPSPSGSLTSGSLTIGSRGTLYSTNDYGTHFEVIDVDPDDLFHLDDLSESPGHFAEWARQMQGGPPAMSNFPDYAGPLTETVLLGNVAIWCGQRVEWDAQHLAVKNVRGLEPLIKPVYREGYTLDA